MYLVNICCMFCIGFLTDLIGMCAFFDSLMLFLCKAPLTCASITLSGLTFKPLAQNP